ncbi:alpha/beta-hydrolase [Trametes elegans]|nr:alpha/beta-hydrolase [Trametes elegans]
MEAIAALNDTAIPLILDPTFDAFVPLLEKKRAQIESISRKTFRYGSTDRHNLDVYYPPAEAVGANGRVPVLVFIYGGGFNTGTRQFDAPRDLIYLNLGAFFAERGILTIIPDYRLLPGPQFAEVVGDVRDALSWVLANPGPLSAGAPRSASPALSLADPALFLMGHSAGAVLASSLFLSPAHLPRDSPVRAAARGLIPQGGVYRYEPARPVLAPGVLPALYGSEESAAVEAPTALVERADDALVRSLPDVFVLVSERDPGPLVDAYEEFVQTLEGRLGKGVRHEAMKGHNHISGHCALHSGEGEEWGEHVVAWIKEHV